MLITVDLLKLIFLGLLIPLVVALKIESWLFNRRLQQRKNHEEEKAQEAARRD
jgi:Na+/H+ antiporter NhaD/arsenite permease-like protein